MATTTATHFLNLDAVTAKSGERTEQIADKQSLLRDGQIAGLQALPSFVTIHVLALFVRQSLKSVHRNIAALEITSDEDRAWCKKAAKKLFRIAQSTEKIEEKIRDTKYLSLFRKWNEDTLCLAEDAAETLALAASPEFTRLLENELEAANARSSGWKPSISRCSSESSAY